MCKDRSIWTIDCRRFNDPDNDRSMRNHIVVEHVDSLRPTSTHRQIESIRKSGAKKIGWISKLFSNKMNPASTSSNCTYHSDAQGQKYKQTLPSLGGQDSAEQTPIRVVRPFRDGLHRSLQRVHCHSFAALDPFLLRGFHFPDVGQLPAWTAPTDAACGDANRSQLFPDFVKTRSSREFKCLCELTFNPFVTCQLGRPAQCTVNAIVSLKNVQASVLGRSCLEKLMAVLELGMTTS